MVDGQNLAKSMGINIFNEVSAKSKENLDTLFNKMAAEVYSKRDRMPINNRQSVKLRANPQGHQSAVPEQGKQKDGCC